MRVSYNKIKFIHMEQDLKYKIEFIEQPDVFDINEMSQIYGGGLCIGYSTIKDCGCNMECNKGTYTSCNDDTKKTQNKNKDKKRKLVARYNDILCIIVRITE